MRMTGKHEISLYFHIPFCTRKCHYCHFYVLPDKEESKIQLLKGFQMEWERWLPFLKNKSIKTVYFGGGTPFLFGPERIETILSLVKDYLQKEAEITLEANPENVELDLMKEYKEAGINRISLGIQTLDNDLLVLLGRLHESSMAENAVWTTAEAGISNISIDLMYDLPNQTLTNWEKTLTRVTKLPITHLSLYNLTIEPQTLFFKKQEILKKTLPKEEDSLAMYEMAVNMCEQRGLHQYEISAFAKKGWESKHNLGYWTGRPFLGFGPSAFSYWEGKRFRNIAHLKKYLEKLSQGNSPLDFEEELIGEAKVRELLTIQLRLMEGVDRHLFEKKYGVLPDAIIKDLKHLEQEGFISNDQVIALTKKGKLFYDTIAAELI